MEVNYTTIIIIFLTSLVLSFSAIALILKISRINKWFDRISDRKVHKEDIPRLAGIGFAAAFLVVTLLVNIIFLQNEEFDLFFLPCFIALLIILIFGTIDDFRPLKPRYKLISQLVAALIVIVPGFIFRRITYIDIGILPLPFSYALTLLWIIGITNAVNLIDGIDGLAGGLTGIIAISIGLIYFFYGSSQFIVLYCVILIGVILGFLVFNAPLPKAKIFMGDCGSQFLGFLLALLFLLERQDTVTSLPVPYAAALLSIPIFDTIAAVWRRLRDKIKIDTPDRSHIHHKLLNLGLSVPMVDIVLFTLQIILGILVFISIHMEGLLSLLVLLMAYLLVLAFFTVIHFKNQDIKRKISDTPPPPFIKTYERYQQRYKN